MEGKDPEGRRVWSPLLSFCATGELNENLSCNNKCCHGHHTLGEWLVGIVGMWKEFLGVSINNKHQCQTWRVAFQVGMLLRIGDWIAIKNMKGFVGRSRQSSQIWKEHSSDVAKPEVGIQWWALTAWKIPTLSRAVATFAILQHNTFAITWYSNNNKMITITTKWAMQRCHTITGLSKSYSFQRTKYLFVDQKLESIHWTNWPWLIALWSLCCFKLHVVIYVKTIGPYHIIRPRSVQLSDHPLQFSHWLLGSGGALDPHCVACVCACIQRLLLLE